ncbi:MAG: ABC transporter permease [Symbiobacteriaceae bacterium]|nr:ABC transporter permease [Symbiobacteriaceae bacterium]
MVNYVIKRVLLAILTIFVIATLVFVLSRAIPGGPFDRERPLPPTVIENLNRKYGLDQPLFNQYLLFMRNVAVLDFGISYHLLGDETVNELIARTFPVSCLVGVWAFALAVLCGIPFGIISALMENRPPDVFFKIMTTLFISIPSFVVAALLQYTLAVRLGWLPVAMWGSWKQVVMPVIALSAGPLATITRFTRASMREVLDSDYIRTARAKGASSFTVTYVHALRNALLPIVTVAGPMFISIIGGSLVIERIFALPGLGWRLVQAITGRDYSVIMGLTIFYAILLIAILLVVDLLYAFIDPRIKISQGSRSSEGGD